MDICPIFPEFQGKSDFQGEWGSYKNFDFHLDLSSRFTRCCVQNKSICLQLEKL